MEQLSLSRLTLLNLRLANLTFGGGLPTMAAMQQEMVANRKWLSPEKFASAYALARITPGTNMLACCAGVAWELLGWPGAILSVLAASIPGAVLAMLLTGSYEMVRSNPLAMAATGAMLAGAVGMMASSAWDLLRPYLSGKRWIHGVIIGGGAVLLTQEFAVSPIAILGLAAVLGLVWRVPE